MIPKSFGLRFTSKSSEATPRANVLLFTYYHRWRIELNFCSLKLGRRINLPSFWKTSVPLIVGLFTVDRAFDGGLTFGAFTLAVIFLLLWLNSRRHVVTISSNGGAKLNFLVERMGEEQVQEFVDKVEAAKVGRMK